MKWTEDIIHELTGQGSLKECERLIENALSRAGDFENLKDLLGASSILLHAGILRGELVLPPLGRALEAADMLRGPDVETAIIGIGDIGRLVLEKLQLHRLPGASAKSFYLDIESSKVRDIGEGIVYVILGAIGESDVAAIPRYSDYLRAVYRAAAVGNRPPVLLAENLASTPEAKVTIHVVIGLEDPWISVLPDLLIDLRTLLGRGARGRTILHLLTRPAPKLRGTFRDVLKDLEGAKPFDEAFVLCANEDLVAERASKFIQLSSQLPELLLHHGGGARGGVFASYGIARAPRRAENDSEMQMYLSRLEIAVTAASPSWIPGNAVLQELTQERFFLIHSEDSAAPETAWRLCQDLVTLHLDDCEPTLCRIQRGLRLGDLRLS